MIEEAPDTWGSIRLWETRIALYAKSQLLFSVSEMLAEIHNQNSSRNLA
jgi:hypothetical protein